MRVRRAAYAMAAGVLMLALAGPAAPMTRAAPIPASPGLRWSGVGTRFLPPFRLVRGGTVRWRTTGGIFFIIVMNNNPNVGNPQLVVTQARSGASYMPPGRYLLKISTSPGTRWTVGVKRL